MTTKICRICKIDQPIDNFPLRGDYKDKRRTECRKCHNTSVVERHKDPAKLKRRREMGRESATRNRLILRKQVMLHYGNKCAHCGEKHYEFLTIDHVYNNGAEHRKEIPQPAMVRWIIKNNYPDTFQILCWNCNAAKQFHKYNPILREKEITHKHENTWGEGI